MGHTLSWVLFLGFLAVPGTGSSLGAGPRPGSGADPRTNPQSSPDSSSPQNQSSITVPAGTHVLLALTSPLWAKSAAPGTRVYAQTAFPVAMNNAMVIPAGTYVEGIIDALKRPMLRSNRAQFQMHFTKWIFADGYTVELADTQAGEAAIATVLVEVSSRSDLLLDNGAQFEMVVQRPIPLEAEKVAKAAQAAKPLTVAKVQSATRCRPIPPAPGTPDTVIPGTPGTPGTPPTVIPGGPGMPDTVIPGIPPTEGTPPTVIRGTPETLGVPCPDPPEVVASSNVTWNYSESFRVTTAFVVAGTKLPAGKYQATWTGLGPQVQVNIFNSKTATLSVPAHVVPLHDLTKENSATTREEPDGTTRLILLKFKKESVALSFEDQTVKSGPTGTAKPPN